MENQELTQKNEIGPPTPHLKASTLKIQENGFVLQKQRDYSCGRDLDFGKSTPALFTWPKAVQQIHCFASKFVKPRCFFKPRPQSCFPKNKNCFAGTKFSVCWPNKKAF
eukprot:UN23781